MHFRKLKLWEVMVCLGILVCAVGVLWPVHACACGGGAKKTFCISNTKQINTALLIYMSDWNDKLPDRHAWIDTLGPYTKNPGLFHDIEIEQAPDVFGRAFNSRLSLKSASAFPHPETLPSIFDSSDLKKNASDPYVSLPHPGRHKGRNTVGYLDGRVKAVSAAAE